MTIQDLARKRSIQVLVGFGAVTLIGYYFWLKKQKDAMKWAQATGSNKLLTEPKEVTACKKACAGSSDMTTCMGQCLTHQTSVAKGKKKHPKHSAGSYGSGYGSGYVSGYVSGYGSGHDTVSIGY